MAFSRSFPRIVQSRGASERLTIASPLTPAPAALLALQQHTVRFRVAEATAAESCARSGRVVAATLCLDDEPLCEAEIVVRGLLYHAAEVEVIAAFANVAAQVALWQALRRQLGRRGGDIGAIPRLPGRGEYSEAARQERLRFLRQQTGAALDVIAHTRLVAEELSHNTESFIGATELPIGVAGPLRVNFVEGPELIYAPLATTEGALVASTTRGALALTQSGGVNVAALDQRIERVPMFELDNLDDALFFADWIEAHDDQIHEQVRAASRRAELKAIEPQLFGRRVDVHFVYATADAAGQNMATTTTWHACGWIREQLAATRGPAIRNFMIDGGGSSDKSVSHRSFLYGRGTRVVAEGRLRDDVIRRTLKLEPRQLAWGHRAITLSSLAVSTVGANGAVANVIAGIFAATGQDLGCVHESSLALLQVEPDDDDIYVSMVLPGLIVGTIGGGTAHAPQRQARELMGCVGEGKAARLAQIIGAFCLAATLSTLAALTGGQFAEAHERLGRNRPPAVTSS